MLQNKCKRTLALTLAASLLLTSAAFAAAPKSTCDEAYYVTLDYYGASKESSIVKSYSLNGEKRITDYGSYASVKNMTNYAEPTVTDNKVVFDFGDDAPDRFYFEGKTIAPLKNLPWKIDVSYQLNGVPADANTLAGKKGLIEIDLDILPNKEAPAYYRNNMILQAATIVDSDKALSVEAEGAQVQSVGNLKAVVFMAMPGEEQHFVLRLGSDDFEFAGWTFLMVPATLSQLDKINDLREAKETVEDSADAISDSLDVILGTMSALSGSLRTTASGLDALDEARGTISSGKGTVYADAETSRADLQTLVDQLAPFDAHLSNTITTLNEMNTVINELPDQFTTLEKAAKDVQTDLKSIRDFAEDANDNLDSIQIYSNQLESSLKNLKATMTAIAGSSSRMASAASALSADDTDGSAALLGAIAQVGSGVGQLSKALTAVIGATAPVISDLSNFAELLNDDDDGLISLAIDHEDDIPALTKDFEAIASVAEKSSVTANKLITVVNEHHSGLTQSIEDARTMINSTRQSVQNLHTLLTDADALLKKSGGQLDEGTKQTLAGLTRALRKSAEGLDRTGTIKNAKDTVKDLMDDKWDEYTGEDNNLLLMDSTAEKLSLTSLDNSAPNSVQILLRTQEITKDDDADSKDVDESFHAEGNFLTRVFSIFKSIWDAITGMFA